MYLLDTNHCSRIIENDAQVIQQLEDRREQGFATSVIACGELLFMAWNSERRDANLGRVKAFLTGIRIYLVDGAIADAYGELKAGLIRRLGPREKIKRRKIRIEEWGIRDNDLWMAAIALRHRLTVVSSDRDFERIRVVKPFPLETWWTSGEGKTGL